MSRNQSGNQLSPKKKHFWANYIEKVDIIVIFHYVTFQNCRFSKTVDWSELEATLLANYVTCTLWTLTTSVLIEMATWYMYPIPFPKQLYLMRRFWKITDIESYTQKSDLKMVFSRDSIVDNIRIYVNIFATHLWKIDFRNKFLEIRF